uniref:Elongation of very long chain fatty acids protein n=1 Tax=Brachionus rotundiformis TaxID=96890 RepID=A0A482G1H3_9BILA|nr:elongation of very long chain fatty acid 10 [Brachionus rotundiformis]
MEILAEKLHHFKDYLSHCIQEINLKEHGENLTNLYMNHTNQINENVKDWPFMDSIDTTACISAFYLAIVLFLNFFMKFFYEIKLKFVVLCFNMFMIGLNFYVFSAILVTKYQAKDYGLCSTIHRYNEESFYKMNQIIWWFYITKGFELLKTVFFLLRRKFDKINLLHIFNHSTMFPVWWIATAYFSNGAIANAALMNSMLHIVMHFYFVVSSFGPSFQKFIWWKRYIVQFQMLQFCVLILYFSFLLRTKCENPLSENMIWYIIYYSLIHVALIYSFYTRSYYKIMNANLEGSKKIEQYRRLNNDFESENDFKVNATRRRPLHN